jgi:hypothetical protein
MDNGVLVFDELSPPPVECGSKGLKRLVRIGGDPHEVEGACQDQKHAKNLTIPSSSAQEIS